ncbi:hypothetical protein yc1106_02990 [Curvularia clavata]|uniref:MINDY deubiquitinase domain-containing protein n=1 Tax=Curvularia clavata TaxID=95742 RepID=A0A9Q8Z3T1_CURCL|nr:hypothetical protein yc1106_02990 [Curvularia clavata]
MSKPVPLSPLSSPASPFGACSLPKVSAWSSEAGSAHIQRSIHAEGSLQLCNVRIRGGLNNLEKTGRKPQRHMGIGANVRMHGKIRWPRQGDKAIPYATVFLTGNCVSAHFCGYDARREEVLELVDGLQGLIPRMPQLEHSHARCSSHLLHVIASACLRLGLGQSNTKAASSQCVTATQELDWIAPSSSRPTSPTMVLRKPDEHDGLVPAPLSKANPPYPTTPSEEYPPVLPSTPDNAIHPPNPSKSPAFNFKTPADTEPPKDVQDDDSDLSDDEWNQTDDEFEEVDPHQVPAALKPAGGKMPPVPKTNNVTDGLPDALRPGPPPGVPIKRSMENMSSVPTGGSPASYGARSYVSEQSNSSIPLQTNNPYLKMQTTGQSNLGGESSEAIWGDAVGHAHKHDAPVELPAYRTPSTPTHEMRNLGLDDHAPSAHPPASTHDAPAIAVNSPTPQSEQNVSLIDVNPWESAPSNKQTHTSPWTAPESNTSGTEAASKALPVSNVSENFPIVGQTPPQPQYTPEQTPSTSEEHPPALPPRKSHEENPPAMPPRPIDTGVGSNVPPALESPNTAMNRQRKEHYQIKHVRWLDDSIKEMRVSPILTQNLNGPCPLLALVNALVLSTPANIETALVETLRTRETVSLGLLLDAVFEELMSGRRGDAAQELPDVSELYKFLLALHTGLNVNPMFVPDPNSASNHAALTNRAGAFEDTRDMKLYRTFNIPLMHGWLPEADTDAFAAFNRVAPSYEASQLVQFQEEELNTKLNAGDSLNDEEQQLFTDIHAIKEFLMRWPTQLTDHGLKVIKDNLQLGQVAILFRNDHFSTLCKNPRNGQLVTLVTDQGYATHDEIVWESLIDVNGQGSQLYSGDFRSVDNSSSAMGTQDQQPGNLVDMDDTQGWTTVQGRRGNQQQSGVVGTNAQDETTSPTGLSRAEQEDHDLALALQLQEEEEDRQRRETEQRARNNQAPPSRPEQTPAIPPRRNNITGHRPAAEPAPPPTYEEASSAPRYNPPAGHPANPSAPMPQHGSAYQAMNGGPPLPPGSVVGGRRPGRPMASPNMMPGRPGRRQSAGASGTPGPNGNEERDKCVVM